MSRSAFAAVAAMAVALTMVLAPANAQPRRIQLGTLTCAMSSSIGLIVGSQKNVNCVFRGQAGEPDEAYTGTMTTLGLDIGITTGGVDRLDRIRRHQPLCRYARRQIYWGDSGSVGRGRSRRQRSGRRLKPDRRVATALLARPGGP